MALVFQYGSNMNSARLNSRRRLRGDAHSIGIAITEEKYELLFDLWSQKGNCAAADLVEGDGRRIWGVIYEIPDHLIKRSTSHARKSLDAIEGEGSNYKRVNIKLRWRNGRLVTKPVITYLGIARKIGIQTTRKYVSHLLKGLSDHSIPAGYAAYVKAQIHRNNPRLLSIITRKRRSST